MVFMFEFAFQLNILLLFFSFFSAMLNPHPHHCFHDVWSILPLFF